MRLIIFTYAFLIISIMGCKKSIDHNVVVQVFDATLTEDDLMPLFSSHLSFEDSVFIRSEFIDDWIRRQIILHESKNILNDSEKDFNQEINSLKEDLLYQAALQKLIMERIDTLITDTDLKNYYEENASEFELVQNLVKLRFYKIQKNNSAILKYWDEFQKENPSIYKTLRELAENQNGNYFETTNSWLRFDDVLKELPINTYNQENYLQNNKFIKINDGDFIYFIEIIDFLIKSETSPFEFEKDRIKNIIRNQKKLAQKILIENELKEKALKNKKVIIH